MTLLRLLAFNLWVCARAGQCSNSGSLRLKNTK